LVRPPRTAYKTTNAVSMPAEIARIYLLVKTKHETLSKPIEPWTYTCKGKCPPYCNLTVLTTSCECYHDFGKVGLVETRLVLPYCNLTVPKTSYGCYHDFGKVDLVETRLALPYRNLTVPKTSYGCYHDFGKVVLVETRLALPYHNLTILNTSCEC